MSADSLQDSSMEAGLLRKQQQEEEKSQFTGRGFGDSAPGHPDRPGHDTRDTRKMSTLRRFLLVAVVGLVVMMGMAAGGPCLAAAHNKGQLVKRQDAGSNGTNPPAGGSQPGNPADNQSGGQPGTPGQETGTQPGNQSGNGDQGNQGTFYCTNAGCSDVAAFTPEPAAVASYNKPIH